MHRNKIKRWNRLRLMTLWGVLLTKLKRRALINDGTQKIYHGRENRVNRNRPHRKMPMERNHSNSGHLLTLSTSMHNTHWMHNAHTAYTATNRQIHFRLFWWKAIDDDALSNTRKLFLTFFAHSPLVGIACIFFYIWPLIADACEN